jgi:hypothetical protein
MSERLSRRRLLGALAVGLAAGPVVAMAAHEDADLLALGAQLEAAWKRQNEADAQCLAGDGDESYPAVEAAWDVCHAIALKIERLRASTIEELRVKARAVLWCHSGEDRIELSEHQTTDIRLAQSILDDLL